MISEEQKDKYEKMLSDYFAGKTFRNISLLPKYDIFSSVEKNEGIYQHSTDHWKVIINENNWQMTIGV